jgi:hypothetical protein
MRLVRLLAASVALTVSGAAVAGGHVVTLQPGSAGIVRGHAGLHAADAKSERALVRIVAPGLEIDERGTIRVLVMNLGPEPFEFGPDNVKLTLADGSELKQVPMAEYERAYDIITREQNRMAAVNMQTRNSLSSIGQMPSGSNATPADSGDVSAVSQRANETPLPGSNTLDAMYEVLMPETVPSQAASGGYLVFEMPEQAKAAASDIPLTIMVRTGGEEHRFAGVLKWRR